MAEAAHGSQGGVCSFVERLRGLVPSLQKLDRPVQVRSIVNAPTAAPNKTLHIGGCWQVAA